MDRGSVLMHRSQSQETLQRQSQSYSHNCLPTYKTPYFIREQSSSTYSLPILYQEKASLVQFIAKEKDNLQFFPSFRKSKTAIKNEDNSNPLMRNFYFLPYNTPNNYHSALNNSKVDNDEKTTTTTKYMSHSSNFTFNTSSNKLCTKRRKSMEKYFDQKIKGTINCDGKKRIHCVERHISFMNNDQTKAAICFIRQLNTYINQRILSVQNDFTGINRFNEHSRKSINSKPKPIELDTSTISTVDFLARSSSNDLYPLETNDSIDISMQLSDQSNSSSRILLNRNDELFAFYNQAVINNKVGKTIDRIRANDFAFDDETNIHDIEHLSLEKQRESDNEQFLLTRCEDKTASCCCGLTKSKHKTDNSVINPIKMQATLIQDKKYETHLGHEAVVSTAVLQTTEQPMKLTDEVETKDSTFEKTEINIQQQSTMFNSLLTDHNYNPSKVSRDQQNFFHQPNEKKCSPPLHSRCLVSFEFANREEHLLELVELPRLSHRISRLDTYTQIRERLTIIDLTDIDLSNLLRTVLQSFIV